MSITIKPGGKRRCGASLPVHEHDFQATAAYPIGPDAAEAMDTCSCGASRVRTLVNTEDEY